MIVGQQQDGRNGLWCQTKVRNRPEFETLLISNLKFDPLVPYLQKQ